MTTSGEDAVKALQSGVVHRDTMASWDFNIKDSSITAGAKIKQTPGTCALNVVKNADAFPIAMLLADYANPGSVASTSKPAQPLV